MAAIQQRQQTTPPRSSEPPKKRRRSSRLGSIDIPDGINALRRETHNMRPTERTHEIREKGSIISSNSKLAGQTVETFLSKHIPDQYAPLGVSGTHRQQDPNSKFCYRHRPDLKCRRQADEPSMDQLQRDLDSLPQDDRQGIAHVWSLFSAAPSKHRNLILQGILAQCCFPQLSYLSANVKELIRIDFLSALPTELSFKILCFLDTTSLCKAAQVSRRWRQLADDDVVWHRMCEQHIDRKCTKCGVGLPLLERKRLRATKRQIQLRATGRGLDTESPKMASYSDAFANTTVDSDGILSQKREDDQDATADASLQPVVTKSVQRPCLKTTDSEYFRKTRPWKDVYKDRFKVGTNWKYGRCTVKTFKGHANGIMCLQQLDNVLATGSYDATIKIWNIENGEENRTLTGHRLGIRCLQMDDSKLISGSLDCLIKVWNWRTGECLATYTKHRDGIIGLHFDGNLMASVSIDRTVRIWNFGDKSSYTLKGHADWVNAVKLDVPSNTVFSASDDFTVKLWDLETKTCLRTYEGHVGQVQQVIPLLPEFEVEIEDGGDDYDSSATAAEDSASQLSAGTGSPPLPNTETDYPFYPHHSNPNNHNPPSGPFKPFGEAFSPSKSRPLPPRYMLTSALDSTIRLWDTRSGRCLRTFFGHVEGVWAIAADTLRVVSGAQDRMVKVWDTRTGKCDRTFTGHTRPVTCIGLSDSRICTGSEDGEARVYSFSGSSDGGEVDDGGARTSGTPSGSAES